MKEALKSEIPEAVNIVLYRINKLNRTKKVSCFFRKTDHVLSTGFLISSCENSDEFDSIFYSTLSRSFYFFSKNDNEIYTYLENNGLTSHINNFFDSEKTLKINTYLVTL